MATIQELESFKLSDAVDFHEELNPRLWEDNKLDPEVRDQLMLIAEDFVEYLGISNLKVKDVTISGSNAAYSYTPHSDLDLHVLVDFNELPNNEVYQELFTAKKTLYNDAHDITVRDVPVELYVQDTNHVQISLGEYSIVHDKWIRVPKKRKANFDEVATKAKYEKLGDLVELALKSRDPKRVKDTIDLVKRYRKAGLEKAGEFGPENLAYKAVRKQGLIQDLYDLKVQLHTEKLSIDEAASRDDALLKIKKLLNTAGRTDNEKQNIKGIVAKMMKQWNIDPSDIGIRQSVDPLKAAFTGSDPLKAKIAKAGYEKTMAADNASQEWNRFKKARFAENDVDEDYDPNGPPPGPEFKPTMPAGTVKVDVSDVYDWYKLGQHISNLKGLGKHDFGQGPPSTIFSFGSEDQEHKYIQDLEKTGLTTTDIDPIDPNQPKGMKRQKTDPTYNVNETDDRKAAVLKIQKHLNKKYGANLDLDGKLGPLTLKSINKFMPRAKTGLADEPNKTTAVQGKKLKEASGYITTQTNNLWEFAKPKQYDREQLQEALEEYFKKDGKWYPHRIHGISSLVLQYNKLVESTRETWVDEVKDFWNSLRRLDHRSKIKLDIGSKISVLQLYTHAYDSDKVFEFRGNITPKKIVDMEVDSDDRIETIYFEDGTSFPDRSFIDRGQGGELDGIITMFFESAKAAEQVLLVAELTKPTGWKISKKNLQESVTKIKEASGYIPSAKEKNDPRFKTALTVDVKPDAIKKNAKAFNWKTSRAGIPPQARADGKITEDLMREFKTFLGEQQEELFPGYDEQHREKRLGNWLAKSWGVQNGKPQTFYHATTKEFDTFNTHGTGFASALGMAYEVERHGSFFAVDPKFAEGFIEDPNTGRVKEGGRVLPVHLSIQSPIDLRDDALSRMLSDKETREEFKANDIDLNSIYNHFYELDRWELFDGPEGAEFVDNLQRLGFDGAIMNEAIPKNSNAKSGQVWVAFSPNQVKSVYNRGSFSPDDNRLMREDQKNAVPKIGYHVTATKNLPIIQKDGIKADKRGNSYVWDSREMAEWFMDFQNDEGQDRTILKIDMTGLDAKPDPEAEDMSEWSSRFKPGTNGGAWIISGPIPSDKIIG
jgi:hypothetical protein